LLLLGQNRGPCDYDLPQTFTASFDYGLPFGRGKAFLSDSNRFVDALLGGWELTGIVTARSGIPFTPTINGDVANTGVSNQHPQVLASPIYVRQANCWFYVAANSACSALDPTGTSTFAVPGTYTYGNGGRNLLLANGLTQVDFSLLKTLSIDELRKLQLRAEVFNILNHPTFATPSSAINSSSGGQVSSTLNAARIIQLGVKFIF
jgi:hypothetical protein